MNQNNSIEYHFLFISNKHHLQFIYCLIERETKTNISVFEGFTCSPKYISNFFNESAII